MRFIGAEDNAPDTIEDTASISLGLAVMLGGKNTDSIWLELYN